MLCATATTGHSSQWLQISSSSGQTVTQTAMNRYCSHTLHWLQLSRQIHVLHLKSYWNISRPMLCIDHRGNINHTNSYLPSVAESRSVTCSSYISTNWADMVTRIPLTAKSFSAWSSSRQALMTIPVDEGQLFLSKKSSYITLSGPKNVWVLPEPTRHVIIVTCHACCLNCSRSSHWISPALSIWRQSQCMNPKNIESIKIMMWQLSIYSSPASSYVK